MVEFTSTQLIDIWIKVRGSKDLILDLNLFSSWCSILLASDICHLTHTIRRFFRSGCSWLADGWWEAMWASGSCSSPFATYCNAMSGHSLPQLDQSSCMQRAAGTRCRATSSSGWCEPESSPIELSKRTSTEIDKQEVVRVNANHVQFAKDDLGSSVLSSPHQTQPGLGDSTVPSFSRGTFVHFQTRLVATLALAGDQGKGVASARAYK
jgi:hypothetical protein